MSSQAESSDDQSPDGQSLERFPDPDALAQTVAGRLLEAVAAIQAEGRTPSIVLTGGTIAVKIHEQVAVQSGADGTGHGVDWSNVEIWYGDERYVPAGDGQRNALQARNAMIDKLPVDPAKHHEMPASDGEYGSDLDAAATAYGAELLAAAPTDGPWFDILMLGVGPDGHCASLFPGRAEVLDPAPAMGVRHSPKPPPTRISMGMSVLRRAREVWFVATGSEKAEAVTSAYNGADVQDLPAAGPKGTEKTVWFLDEDAAWML